jgi:hypothetical protein
MSDDKPDDKPSFWATFPGILTGLASLITAIGGILVLLKHVPHGLH